MNISITGNLGSGKSSVCRKLKDKGYSIISAGTIFRTIAEEKNISVEELNKLINREIKEGKHDIDDLIDSKMAEMGKTEDNVIFDSRMAWHFVPKSLKVFLAVDVNEAARRIYNDNKRLSESYGSELECLEAIKNRQELEVQRFIDLYSENYYDYDNYDLIIDTTNKSPDEIAQLIINKA